MVMFVQEIHVQVVNACSPPFPVAATHVIRLLATTMISAQKTPVSMESVISHQSHVMTVIYVLLTLVQTEYAYSLRTHPAMTMTYVRLTVAQRQRDVSSLPIHPAMTWMPAHWIPALQQLDVSLRLWFVMMVMYVQQMLAQAVNVCSHLFRVAAIPATRLLATTMTSVQKTPV